MSHFRLPEWKELSRDEQIPIVNLSLERTYFVRGGPGTGKSILAIHRMAKLQDLQPQSRVKLLVYNKPLQLHLTDALSAVKLNTHAQTCHSWILQMTDFRPPSGGLWDYDWEEVRRRVRRKGMARISHLIIDEAQDIPQPLLQILHEISDQATIFVDDKQAINEEARDYGLCQLAGIRAVFEEGPGCTYDLTKNFRNTQQILRAAHAIRPPEDNELIDIAIRQDGPTPTCRNSSIADLIQRIEAYHSNNPNDQIAVAVSRNEEMRLYDALENSDVPVQLYRNKHAQNGTYNACAKGATVLAFDVIKGLEFDAVYIPCLEDEYLHRHGNDEQRQIRENMIYVAATRAKNVLDFSYQEDMPDSWLTKAINQACNAGVIRRIN